MTTRVRPVRDISQAWLTTKLRHARDLVEAQAFNVERRLRAGEDAAESRHALAEAWTDFEFLFAEQCRRNREHVA